MTTVSKIINFLIIGVFIFGIFYALKIGGLIGNSRFPQEPRNNYTLPGFTPIGTPTPKSSSTPTPTLIRRESLPSATQDVLLDVPFTPQAPFGNWSDIRQQSGCEEAAALMAMRWVKGKSLTLEEAEKEIIAISDFELKTYGHFHDTSAEDLVARIFKGYFKYNNVEVRYDIKATDIRSELDKGNLVLVPANGQKLNNPYYKAPGPLEHMLIIRGYDSKTGEFITNDSGTKKGELYRYSEDIVMEAIYDYPTGYHEPVNGIKKVMIVVKKPS